MDIISHNTHTYTRISLKINETFKALVDVYTFENTFTIILALQKNFFIHSSQPKKHIASSHDSGSLSSPCLTLFHRHEAK